jgi:hypothetical protein
MQNLLKSLSALTCLGLSVAFAHSGPSQSIWESQMFAYFTAAMIGGACYVGMVWESPGERKRREQEKR